jgi:imidazolonepropionase-like amidohydrolase
MFMAPTNFVARSLSLVVALVFAMGTAAAQPFDYAITHVTVVNPGSGKPQLDQTIVVSGHTITAVVPSKDFKPTGSLRLVDGRGKFVIPGLWDMHVHFRDAVRDLKMDIANGVLGLRNMGGVAKEVFPLRDAIAQGKQLGPRIVACGPIIDGPDSWSNPQFTISVRTADEARTTVQSLRQQGADCLKVYDGLSRDSYFAIIDEAKKAGLPVAGHLPSAITVREASNAGQRSLEHGIALAGGSSAEAIYIQRRLDPSAFQEALRTKHFALIPAKIASDETIMLDHFSQKLVDETYSLLAKNGTFLTPTLVTQRALTFADDLVKESDPRMQYVSAEELSWWKPENGMLTKYRTPEYIAMRKREYDVLLKEVHRAQTVGVHLLAGTDITIPFTYPGFSLHDELALFVKTGLTPSQALETATTNPALLLGLSKEWGRVSPGYGANFVLLNADPLIDIANTKNINAVVLNGELLNRAKLDQMLLEARITNDVSKPASH